MDSSIRKTRDAPDFIGALCRPAAYAHPVDRIRVAETHISWVLLTGAFAYKIKKPVDLGFLDFSTLQKRRRACEDELRLNRRFAPELYLKVVPITGSEDNPQVDGAGETLEYAVRMRQFPQADQLDRRLTAGKLTLRDMDVVARCVAGFHESASVAPAHRPYGKPAEVHRPFRETLERLLDHKIGDFRAQLEVLRDWSEMRYAVLRAAMTLRRTEGFVREVHGDLHLSNLVRLRDDAIVPFDCIEFSEPLRWIDVLNDIAFLVMDFQFRARDDLAYRLLNRYLERTGDYGALPLLPYYRTYRALVRARIAELRGDAGQLHAYVDRACRSASGAQPSLILMHGFSGSGKSWLSDQLATRLPAIRLRSDIERKRLHGLAVGAASGSGLERGIYSRASSLRTYERLSVLAEAALTGGETVVVDAGFLQREQRNRLRVQARKLSVPFGILACSADRPELERRLRQRERSGTSTSEAGLGVLTHQYRNAEPLTADEQAHALTVDTNRHGDIETIASRIREWMAVSASSGDYCDRAIGKSSR